MKTGKRYVFLSGVIVVLLSGVPARVLSETITFNNNQGFENPVLAAGAYQEDVEVWNLKSPAAYQGTFEATETSGNIGKNVGLIRPDNQDLRWIGHDIPAATHTIAAGTYTLNVLVGARASLPLPGVINIELRTINNIRLPVSAETNPTPTAGNMVQWTDVCEIAPENPLVGQQLRVIMEAGRIEGQTLNTQALFDDVQLTFEPTPGIEYIMVSTNHGFEAPVLATAGTFQENVVGWSLMGSRQGTFKATTEIPARVGDNVGLIIPPVDSLSWIGNDIPADTHTISAGTYTLYALVGKRPASAFPATVNIALRDALNTDLPVISTINPTPGNGQIEAWSVVCKVPKGSALIGNQLRVIMEAAGAGQAAFDNIVVQFEPPPPPTGTVIVIK